MRNRLEHPKFADSLLNDEVEMSAQENRSKRRPLFVQDLPNPWAVGMGMATGLIALFTPVQEENSGWLTFKVVLVVAAFGFAAINLAWMLIRRRKSR